ncbi:hypothetical protein LCGC14_1434710 [marine sediment metagenome]|uniref:Uncharacterized protein n=1 Tax=marine sediment metagenome TaxID=412755 RepID=A0A0F9MPI0_9ZZZZ
MSETGWIALVVISVVLVVGTISIRHSTKLSEEATLIRENCKEETGFYTIDARGRVHTVWDCSFYDVHGGEVQYE